MAVILRSVFFTDKHPILEGPHLSTLFDNRKLWIDTVRQVISHISVDVSLARKVLPIVKLIILGCERVNKGRKFKLEI